MILNWLFSRTARHALTMAKHVQKLVDHQRDLLAPQAVNEVTAAIQGLKQAAASGGKPEIETQMATLETVANKWIKPYPYSAWRENVEVLLVALAVAMGIRTFFLQPFKIPTGSMQPTLFGVNSQNYIRNPEGGIPSGMDRVLSWFAGDSYLQLKAGQDGVFEGAEQPFRLLIFSIYQKVHFAGKVYTLWFPPDYGTATLEQRAGLQPGQEFRQGEDIINLRVSAGDHLFVDRFTYNFRAPKRGEIVVFETKGIEGLPQGEFYIKRLVGLGGETLQVPDDRHLLVDGHRLDAATPHFDRVYSFPPETGPRESRFSGHVNSTMSGQHMAFFPDGTATYKISENHFMVMGDNTMNSLDSRFWGDFPAQNVIGRAHLVYWPISKRFGWNCMIH